MRSWLTLQHGPLPSLPATRCPLSLNRNKPLRLPKAVLRASDGRSEGRKVYELTDQGRAQADPGQLRDLAAGTADGSAHLDLRAEVHRLHDAARQVGTAGDPAQVQEAVEIIRSARQALYQLLAQ